MTDVEFTVSCLTGLSDPTSDMVFLNFTYFWLMQNQVSRSLSIYLCLSCKIFAFGKLYKPTKILYFMANGTDSYSFQNQFWWCWLDFKVTGVSEK